jgi:hypothetical protein
VTDEHGVVVMSARAFTWSRTIHVTDPAGRASFDIERSRLFPLTGRARVRAVPSGLPLGTVSRNGTFRDAGGEIRGKFVDARSLRKRVHAGLIQGAMETLLSGVGDSVPSGPDSFVLQVGRAFQGTLRYGVVPFPAENEGAAAAPRQLRFVPHVLRRFWQSLNAPRGWKLERTHLGADDPRLQLAGAIFAAELSRW